MSAAPSKLRSSIRSRARLDHPSTSSSMPDNDVNDEYERYEGEVHCSYSPQSQSQTNVERAQSPDTSEQKDGEEDPRPGRNRKAWRNARDTDFRYRCEWNGCNHECDSMNEFNHHVGLHQRAYTKHLGPAAQQGHEEYIFYCQWCDCQAQIEGTIDEFSRHVHYHTFHQYLKFLGGHIQAKESKLGPCMLDTSTRNLIPELPEKLMCRWKDCNMVYDNPYIFYSHVAHHCEDVPKLKDSKEPCQCNWEGCKTTIKSWYKLREHMRSHTQAKVVACPTCGSLFANNTKFVDHLMRQSQSGPTFVCSNCSAKFNSERLLRDHMRRHVNHYKCPLCDMTCPTPSNVRDHVRYKHSDNRDFQCPSCDYKAKTSSDLRVHLLKFPHDNDNDEPGARKRSTLMRKLQALREIEEQADRDDAVEAARPQQQPRRRQQLQAGETGADKQTGRQTGKKKTHHQKGSLEKENEEAAVSGGADAGPLRRASANTMASDANDSSCQKDPEDKDDSNHKYTHQCHVCETKYRRGTLLTRHLKEFHNYRWPSGHQRFRYKLHPDGLRRLQTIRLESIEVTQQILGQKLASDEHGSDDGDDGNGNDNSVDGGDDDDDRQSSDGCLGIVTDQEEEREEESEGAREGEKRLKGASALTRTHRTPAEERGGERNKAKSEFCCDDGSRNECHASQKNTDKGEINSSNHPSRTIPTGSESCVETGREVASKETEASVANLRRSGRKRKRHVSDGNDGDTASSGFEARVSPDQNRPTAKKRRGGEEKSASEVGSSMKLTPSKADKTAKQSETNKARPSLDVPTRAKNKAHNSIELGAEDMGKQSSGRQHMSMPSIEDFFSLASSNNEGETQPPSVSDVPGTSQESATGSTRQKKNMGCSPQLSEKTRRDPSGSDNIDSALSLRTLLKLSEAAEAITALSTEKEARLPKSHRTPDKRNNSSNKNSARTCSSSKTGQAHMPTQISHSFGVPPNRHPVSSSPACSVEGENNVVEGRYRRRERCREMSPALSSSPAPTSHSVEMDCGGEDTDAMSAGATPHYGTDTDFSEYTADSPGSATSIYTINPHYARQLLQRQTSQPSPSVESLSQPGQPHPRIPQQGTLENSQSSQTSEQHQTLQQSHHPSQTSASSQQFVLHQSQDTELTYNASSHFSTSKDSVNPSPSTHTTAPLTEPVACHLVSHSLSQTSSNGLLHQSQDTTFPEKTECALYQVTTSSLSIKPNPPAYTVSTSTPALHGVAGHMIPHPLNSEDNSNTWSRLFRQVGVGPGERGVELHSEPSPGSFAEVVIVGSGAPSSIDHDSKAFLQHHEDHHHQQQHVHLIPKQQHDSLHATTLAELLPYSPAPAHKEQSLTQLLSPAQQHNGNPSSSLEHQTHNKSEIFSPAFGSFTQPLPPTNIPATNQAVSLASISPPLSSASSSTHPKAEGRLSWHTKASSPPPQISFLHKASPIKVGSSPPPGCNNPPFSTIPSSYLSVSSGIPPTTHAQIPASNTPSHLHTLEEKPTHCQEHSDISDQTSHSQIKPELLNNPLDPEYENGTITSSGQHFVNISEHSEVLSSSAFPEGSLKDASQNLPTRYLPFTPVSAAAASSSTSSWLTDSKPALSPTSNSIDASPNTAVQQSPQKRMFPSPEKSFFTIGWEMGAGISPVKQEWMHRVPPEDLISNNQYHDSRNSDTNSSQNKNNNIDMNNISNNNSMSLHTNAQDSATLISSGTETLVLQCSKAQTGNTAISTTNDPEEDYHSETLRAVSSIVPAATAAYTVIGEVADPSGYTVVLDTNVPGGKLDGRDSESSNMAAVCPDRPNDGNATSRGLYHLVQGADGEYQIVSLTNNDLYNLVNSSEANPGVSRAPGADAVSLTIGQQQDGSNDHQGSENWGGNGGGLEECSPTNVQDGAGNVRIVQDSPSSENLHDGKDSGCTEHLNTLQDDLRSVHTEKDRASDSQSADNEAASSEKKTPTAQSPESPYTSGFAAVGFAEFPRVRQMDCELSSQETKISQFDNEGVMVKQESREVCGSVEAISYAEVSVSEVAPLTKLYYATVDVGSDDKFNVSDLTAVNTESCGDESVRREQVISAQIVSEEMGNNVVESTPAICSEAHADSKESECEGKGSPGDPGLGQ